MKSYESKYRKKEVEIDDGLSQIHYPTPHPARARRTRRVFWHRAAQSSLARPGLAQSMRREKLLLDITARSMVDRSVGQPRTALP
jgi:hypothetical protein